MVDKKDFFSKAADIVGKSYAKVSEDSYNTIENQHLDLLNQRAIPKEGWDRLTIESLMNKIALMDSNNYQGNTGVGEREGRIYSSIVREKNFALGHGIGRSGDVNAL